MAAAAAKTMRYGQSHGGYRAPGSASYDGNAARALDREEVLRPRPEVRQRQRAVTRPRVQVREAGKVSLFGLVGFLAAGVFAAMVLMCSLQLAVLSDDVVELEQELTILQGEEAKLRAKYELAFDITAIEQEMTANGVMVKPQSSQVVYLDLSEPDSVVLFQDNEAEAGGLQGFLASVGEVFGNIVEYFR